MTNVVNLSARRREQAIRRVLEAAEKALDVLERMPMDQLAVGADDAARAELRAATEELRQFL